MDKSILRKFFIGTLLLIFGLIVLHAPLTVWFGTFLPVSDLFIKAWKEALMVVAVIVLTVILYRRKQFSILREPIPLLIGIYILLHLVLLPINWENVTLAIAGLVVDLRYLVFFVLVYCAIRLYPQFRKAFIGTFAVGAVIVVSFAMLQATVLPNDVLKHIGYNETTTMPYLTVDENPEFIRINSTLRGPNPLGAYAIIVLSLLMAFGLRGHHRQFKRPMFWVALIGIGSITALWASYSRSALVAAIIAIIVLIFITSGKRISKWAWVGTGIAVVAIGGALFAARDSYLVSNVILHENFTTGATINSNEGHIDSLVYGIDRFVNQPLGGGIGSTGTASLLGNHPLIIENQYLFIAHEAGWIGLVLFLMILWKIFRALWEKRDDWLAVGLFASGIGLALIGLLQPVWVDDTVSIIWWGLAAVMIGGSYGRKINKASKRTA